LITKRKGDKRMGGQRRRAFQRLGVKELEKQRMIGMRKFMQMLAETKEKETNTEIPTEDTGTTNNAENALP